MDGSTQFALLNLPISQDRPTPTYHDVFLSCADDTRKRLASHLCKALHRSRVQTFVSIDNDDGGWDACSKGPRIFIVLFSIRYGSWTNRLEELAKAMENRENVAVLPVFVDVEPYEVRYQDGCFREAFVLHEKAVGNRESVDGWRDALTKAGSLKGWHLKNVSNGDEAVLVNLVVQEVLSMLNYAPLFIDKKATGINWRVEEMMVLLDLDVNDVRTVGICGPPGIGKTIIAKAVYNRISGRFDRSIVLENVGELCQKPSGLMWLQNQLARDFTGPVDSMINDVKATANVMKPTIGSARVLVLLDGIDRPSQVDALKGWKKWFGPGSRIVITTKHESILNQNWVHGIYKLKQSGKHDFCGGSPVDSWEMELRHCPTADWAQHGIAVLDKYPQSSEKLGASSDFVRYLFVIAFLECIPSHNLIANKSKQESTTDQVAMRHAYPDMPCLPSSYGLRSEYFRTRGHWQSSKPSSRKVKTVIEAVDLSYERKQGTSK